MNRLFRHIAALVLAGIILTGCAYDDSVRELREHNPYSESLAIAFDNGVIDKPIITKAGALLSDHMNTMGVWGWQTTNLGDVERLFLNQNITYNAPEAKWTYNPLKYWDLKSTYRFSAYAPHSSSDPGVTVTIDSITRAISIKGVTLKGDNTITSGVPTPPGNFGAVQDIDWMVDRNGQSMPGTARTLVTFNMQHILSKLCIRICRSNTFPSDTVAPIIVDSLKVGNFISQGNFTQCMTDDSLKMLAEWTPIDTLPRYTINSARGVSVPDSAVYVVESLIIPQQTDASQNVHIWYKLGGNGGAMSRFNYLIKLDDVFDRFIAGRNYLLTIIIGPDVITFDSGVCGWDDSYTHSIVINQ